MGLFVLAGCVFLWVVSFSIFFSLVADSLLSSICSLCVCCCVNSVVRVSICILSNSASSSLIFSFMVARMDV